MSNSIFKFSLFTLLIINNTSVLAGSMGSESDLMQPSWGGWYLGAQLGGAGSQENWQYTHANYFNTLGPLLLGTQFGFNTQSFIGGGYAGYNYQTRAPWMLGLEASFSGTNLSRTEYSPFYLTDRYNSNLSEIGTVKGRLGYQYNQWLPYVNGGYAYANTSLTLTDPIYHVQSTTSPWNNGWIVGVGLEYQISPKLALGLSYDYSAINLDNQIMSCPNCGTGIGFGTPSVDGDFKTQAVMARLSYLLNP